MMSPSCPSVPAFKGMEAAVGRCAKGRALTRTRSLRSGKVTLLSLKGLHKLNYSALKAQSFCP